jgi:3-phenylpropionate/cinnamic acid dioxygenase small subunit
MSNNLADRLAIQDILTRYAAGVDDRNLQMYRNCFADEAEIVGFSGGTITGADAWTEEVKVKLAAFGSTQHMLGPQMVTIQGDTASTRTDVQALHYLKNNPRETMTLWAVYLTNYRRINGEWKITRHELVRRGTRTQADK